MRHGSSARLAIADRAVLERKERVIPAEADVLPGVDPGADLANQDRASGDFLATEDLGASSLSIGVTTVARTALSLFM